MNRTKLDALCDATERLFREHSARDDIGSDDWHASLEALGAAHIAERTERVRLWKADRWGDWMSAHDRALATISGEIY